MKVGDLVVYTREYLGHEPQTLYVVGEVDVLIPLCRVWARYDNGGPSYYYQNSPTNVRNYRFTDCRNFRAVRESDFSPEVIAKAKSIL